MSAFSNDSVKFLKALKANNNRDWFHENKKDYERLIKHPAADFAAAMADQFERITGTPHGSKIFRINRDIRFSKDKTPYNTHVRISTMAESDATVPPGWFFSFEHDRMQFGAGVFEFPKDALASHRKRIDGADGEELQAIIDGLMAAGARLDEPVLKRVPKPFDADHPRGDLLRRKGIAIWLDAKDQSLAFGKDGAKNCAAEMSKLLPILEWLQKR